MKTTLLQFFVLLLCFLLILPSCGTVTPQESGTESEAISTEKKTEKVEEPETSETESESQIEEITMDYPDIVDLDPDLENVDYSKLSFCTDILTYSGDVQLSTSEISDVRKMKELVEANKSEWKQVASYDEGLELLKKIIADSKNTDCAIMLIVDYTFVMGTYAVDTHYKDRCDLGYPDGEKQCIWFYSKDWIERGFTPSPEKLLEAFERFTRYSTFTSVVIAAVPIPAEN
jgi:hypothetical protein